MVSELEFLKYARDIKSLTKTGLVDEHAFRARAAYVLRLYRLIKKNHESGKITHESYLWEKRMLDFIVVKLRDANIVLLKQQSKLINRRLGTLCNNDVEKSCFDSEPEIRRDLMYQKNEIDSDLDMLLVSDPGEYIKYLIDISDSKKYAEYDRVHIDPKTLKAKEISGDDLED